MGAGSLRPGELGKHHVRALVELHDKAGRPATARHRHSALVRLYGWLQAVDAIEDNPASSVRVPPPPPPRTNVPSAQAVKALWDAAGRLQARRRGHRPRADRRARSCSTPGIAHFSRARFVAGKNSEETSAAARPAVEAAITGFSGGHGGGLPHGSPQRGAGCRER